MSKTRTVTINEEEFVIKKIPVTKMGAIAQSIQNLPAMAKEIFVVGNDDATVEAFMDNIIPLVVALGDALPDFLSAASGIDKSRFHETSLEEALELLTAIFELNNIGNIIKYIKNFQQVLVGQIAQA